MTHLIINSSLRVRFPFSKAAALARERRQCCSVWNRLPRESVDVHVANVPSPPCSILARLFSLPFHHHPLMGTFLRGVLVPGVPSDSENYVESRILIKIPMQFNPELKKKKKIKFSLPAGDGSQNPSGQQVIRKCMHCQINKTPQWRAGPMGPKTLCNACGVRYKSGRLFLEYRSAASPTFVPSLQSNSHKRVVQMRTKGSATPVTDSPVLIPNKSNPTLDYIYEKCGGKLSNPTDKITLSI